MRLRRMVSITLAVGVLACTAGLGLSRALAIGRSDATRNATAISLAEALSMTATQQARLTGALGRQYFGAQVAISGNTAVVGVPWENDYSGPGVAYVFVRSGTTWSLQATLRADDGSNYDWFGSSVSISGDTAIVGASRDEIGSNYDQGSAYVFVRSGNDWSQQAHLVVADGNADDHLGGAVGVDGDTALVDGYVFTRSETSWSQQAKLVVEGIWFTSAGLSGDTAVLGALHETVGENTDQGAAYVFVRSGTNWSQQARLLASDGAAGDEFGYSVAIAGDTVLVGSPYDDWGGHENPGSAYVYGRSGASWSQQENLVDAGCAAYAGFGVSVGLDGDAAVVGAPWDGGWGTPLAAPGTASLFVRSGTSWSQEDKLSAVDAAGGDHLGYSVALSGSTAIAGAPDDDVSGLIDQGSAYVFTFTLPDTTPPHAPSGVSATARSATSIHVAWTACADPSGIREYRVFMNGTLKAIVIGTSVTVDGLTPATSYSIFVAAVDNAANLSEYSSTVHATTLAAPIPTTLSLSGPSTSPSYNGSATLKARLKSGTSGIGSKSVVFERWSGSAWGWFGTAVTDTNGYATKWVSGLKTRQTYRARFAVSAPYGASKSASVYVNPKTRLTRSSSWDTKYDGKTYYYKGYIEPKHSTSDTNKVKFKMYRKGSDGEYHWKKTVTTYYSYYSSTKTRWTAKVVFPSSGRWRVRAHHAADTKNSSSYSSYDYVTVK